MEKTQEGTYVGVSVKALYDAGIDLEHCLIVTSGDNEIRYYDLYNKNSEFVCCDGEVCYVEKVGAEYITLRNESGENPVSFTLSQEETSICCYSSC